MYFNFFNFNRAVHTGIVIAIIKEWSHIALPPVPERPVQERWRYWQLLRGFNPHPQPHLPRRPRVSSPRCVRHEIWHVMSGCEGRGRVTTLEWLRCEALANLGDGEIKAAWYRREDGQNMRIMHRRGKTKTNKTSATTTDFAGVQCPLL